MLPAPGFSRELHYFIARARDTISDDALGHPCESRAVCVLFVGLMKQPLASACLLKNLISMVGACTHAKMIQSSGDLLSFEDGALMSLIGKLLAHQTAAPFEPDQGSGPKEPVSWTSTKIYWTSAAAQPSRSHLPVQYVPVEGAKEYPRSVCNCKTCILLYHQLYHVIGKETPLLGVSWPGST